MGLIIATSMLSLVLLGVSCAPGRDFNARLSSIVKPYNFSIARWEFNTIFNEAKQVISGRDKRIENEVNKATEYFSSTE